MTTLVRRSASQVPTDREGLPGGGRPPKGAAEVRWIGGVDPLRQEADLLVRAAHEARERGLAGDHELALWLERSMHRMWTGGGPAAPELAAALAIARALTGEPADPDFERVARPN